MKYSDLIEFSPIEDVVQLTTAKDKEKARGYVQSYVLSDRMADNLKVTVLDQLSLDEVVNNLGVLVVGNYGTGKSHLMSVISAIATDSDNVQYLKNQRFAKEAQSIAGRYEALRIEIGGSIMYFYDIITGFIQDDFNERGIDFEFPEYEKVKDFKKVIREMMAAFNAKYPDKGYLVIVDEFLAYMASRNEMQLNSDLEFLRVLGEMCSKSNFRIILGVQEKIFDNPRFAFVSSKLKHVSDRFTQLIITKEATAYVVSERVLKKTAAQKALIREHLEKYSSLYGEMSSRMDEFVDMFPIHPAYIDIFNKLYLIENRHILKNISVTIRNIFNEDVSDDEPGIISFDNYWPAIKSNGMLKADPDIGKVADVSQHLEDIINRSFPTNKRMYKPMVKRIIYALSVHRLSTEGMNETFGMTAEKLKDDLCLYTMLPEMDSDFLLGFVNSALREMFKVLTGQFIVYNESNSQYYIDVNKVDDYDQKIKQKAEMLDDSELNRYFYDIVYSCLDWTTAQYVPGFNIYQYELNWNSHNMYREGYLFMGLPGERSTAQPERDFYIHIMPPYGNNNQSANDLTDEVYLYFKSKDEFKELLTLYAAASILYDTSDTKIKENYIGIVKKYRKELQKYLNNNITTSFDIAYDGKRKQLIEVLKGKYKPDETFKSYIDLAASISLDECFNDKYPKYPVFKTKITSANRIEMANMAMRHFAGQVTKNSEMILNAFGILDGNKIKPEGSKYASYYLDKVKKLNGKEVINFTDLFEIDRNDEDYYDKEFGIEYIFTPVIFLSLVYSGHAVMTLEDGFALTASNLDVLLNNSNVKFNITEIGEFKYLSKPADIMLPELKALFEVIGINPALLDNSNSKDKAIEELLKTANDLCVKAVTYEKKITSGELGLWNESLVDDVTIELMKRACPAINKEFSNYATKYNKAAKLNNFSLSMADIEKLGKHIENMELIPRYIDFRNECINEVTYVANIEHMNLSDELKKEIQDAKGKFRTLRDSIVNGANGTAVGQKVLNLLYPIRDKYKDIYLTEHKKKRLGATATKKKGELQSSRLFSNLKKLKNGIDGDIIPRSKLTNIENELSSLKTCYSLTPTDLNTTPYCPHCNYRIGDMDKNVSGVLENVEILMDKVMADWTDMLYNTITDPMVWEQGKYLKPKQKKVVEEFKESKILPEQVDDFFVDSINALLDGFDPVIINTQDFIHQLEAMPPMNEADFRKKIDEIVSTYISGKDKNKLRIIVKNN